MKKAIKIFSLASLLLLATLIFAQPPDPDGNPDSDGGTELGGNAPIGSGLILLSLLSGFYAVGKTTYNLKKKK